MSQPDPRHMVPHGESDQSSSPAVTAFQGLSFSQPIHPDHMLLSSQLQGTPGSSQVKSRIMLLSSQLQVTPSSSQVFKDPGSSKTHITSYAYKNLQ